MSNRAWARVTAPGLEWLLLLIPLALCLAILLAAGPYLQTFGYSSLEQGAPSLAQAKLGPSRVILPEIADWLAGFTYLPFLCIALISAFIGLTFKSLLQIAVITGIALFALLSMLDFIVDLSSGQFTADTVVRDILADLVGGSQHDDFSFLPVRLTDVFTKILAADGPMSLKWHSLSKEQRFKASL